MTQDRKFSRAEIRETISNNSVSALGYRLNSHSNLASDIARHISTLLRESPNATQAAIVGSLSDTISSRGISRELARNLSFDLAKAFGFTR